MHVGLPSALLAGLQPDREHVVEGQNDSPDGSRPDVRSSSKRDRGCVAGNHSRRLRWVLPSLWIRRATKSRNALTAERCGIMQGRFIARRLRLYSTVTTILPTC